MTDLEWHLLLLGAGVNSHEAPLLKVAEWVLENADHHAGYFTPTVGAPASPTTRPPLTHFRAIAPAVAPGVRALATHSEGGHAHARP